MKKIFGIILGIVVLMGIVSVGTYVYKCNELGHSIEEAINDNLVDSNIGIEFEMDAYTIDDYGKVIVDGYLDGKESMAVIYVDEDGYNNIALTILGNDEESQFLRDLL